VAARLKSTPPTVQQMVVRMVLTDHQVFRAVVRSVLVGVMHFNTSPDRMPKRHLGYHDVFVNATGAVGARVPWHKQRAVSATQNDLRALAPFVIHHHASSALSAWLAARSAASSSMHVAEQYEPPRLSMIAFGSRTRTPHHAHRTVS